MHNITSGSNKVHAYENENMEAHPHKQQYRRSKVGLVVTSQLRCMYLYPLITGK